MTYIDNGGACQVIYQILTDVHSTYEASSEIL